jgi:hypothetical protein
VVSGEGYVAAAHWNWVVVEPESRLADWVTLEGN